MKSDARSVARFTAPLVIATTAALFGGCTKISYHGHIETRPNPRVDVAVRPPILVDIPASYVEVASDANELLPSARYERAEVVSAIAAAWNQDAEAGTARPARVLVIADIEHAASDIAGGVIHGILGVTYLLGLPHSCGYADVTVAVQTVDGDTWLGKGEGSGCSGLYYPQDHRMTALADSISDALANLAPTSAQQVALQEPRVQEVVTISSNYHRYPIERIVWPVRATAAFPVPWGAEPNVAHHAGSGLAPLAP